MGKKVQGCPRWPYEWLTLSGILMANLWDHAAAFRKSLLIVCCSRRRPYGSSPQGKEMNIVGEPLFARLGII